MLYGSLFSLVFGLSFCLAAQIIPTFFTRIFSTDPAVIQSAAQFLRSDSLDCVILSFVFCFNAYFSGCQKSLFAMTHSLIATFLVRIPLSFFLSRLPHASMYLLGLSLIHISPQKLCQQIAADLSQIPGQN